MVTSLNHLQDDDAVCYADYCDIFRCQGYLHENVTGLTSEDLVDLDNLELYELAYPDLGVSVPSDLEDDDNGANTQLIPAPPPDLLDLLNMQQKRGERERVFSSETDKGNGNNAIK